NSITYIDKPLYHYRIRVGSIMNNSDNVIIARKKLDVLSALDERIKLITSLRKYSVFLQKTEIFYVNQYFRTKKFLKQQSVMFKEDNYIDAYRMYGRLLRKVKLVDKLKLIKNRFF
ncbi:TPA: glycosyltransferase family 2 protein, partial [Streptococcus agalactiae]